MLVYPGLKYNINGPITTLRLESIREGQEEYEYFWLFENYVNTYNEANHTAVDAHQLFSRYCEDLYANATVIGTSQLYHNKRSELLSVLEEMKHDLNGAVESLIN